jgi:tetratricopeptide (TPR) repeat protein
MTILKTISMKHSTAAVLGACWLLALGSGAPLLAQGTEPVEERRALSNFADPTSAGNTAQATRMLLASAMRDLEQAEALANKAATVEDEKKADKLAKQSVSANESAVEQFIQVLKKDPTIMEAYDSMGLAFRRMGRYQEALEIHGVALRRDPSSLENFRGWSEALLSLNFLGDAVTQYANYLEMGSPNAPILMEEIKKWLAAKQADPGDLEPAHVQRMTEWVAENDTGS